MQGLQRKKFQWILKSNQIIEKGIEDSTILYKNCNSCLKSETPAGARLYLVPKALVLQLVPSAKLWRGAVKARKYI